MKARAWFFMLSIMVIGFTGFGTTTADLNHNSDTVLIQMEAPEAVMVNVVSDMSYADDPIGIDVNTYQNTPVYNWQNNETIFKESKLLKTYPRINLRKPRDGLRA